jgi:hypothetical protein
MKPKQYLPDGYIQHFTLNDITSSTYYLNKLDNKLQILNENGDLVFERLLHSGIISIDIRGQWMILCEAVEYTMHASTWLFDLSSIVCVHNTARDDGAYLLEWKHFGCYEGFSTHDCKVDFQYETVTLFDKKATFEEIKAGFEFGMN